MAGETWGNNPIFQKTAEYNSRRQLLGMKKSLENKSNILDIRVKTTGKSSEDEPRLEKNVVLALSSRFSHLEREVTHSAPLALTMRCEPVSSESEGEQSGESEGEENSSAGKMEGEDQEEGDNDEETREQAKVPKKRPCTVDMPSAAQERIFRKR